MACRNININVKLYAADCEGKTTALISVISKLHFTGQSCKEMTQTKLLKRIPLQ
jgi:hypothetical protein